MFDTKREIITESTKSKRRLIISPPLQTAMPPRGILQTEAKNRRRMKKPMSLSFTEVRSTRTISEDSTTQGDSNRKVDLIHDDWFGLAPLASPESLSEISSISSRATSLGKLNLNSSIERVFLMASCQEEEASAAIAATTTASATTDYGGSAEEDLLLDDKEDMKTPVIMRRAIKIDTELSRCGDNWAEVEKYKRHGKVFVSKTLDDSGSLVDDDTDSSECGRPSLVGSFAFSRPSAQRVNQLMPNGGGAMAAGGGGSGRKPFVEISCSSDSSSCASSLAGSFRTAQNEAENTLLIDFNSKSTECLDSSLSEATKRKLNASEEMLGDGQKMVRQSLKVMDEGGRNLAQSDSAILEDTEKRRSVSLKRIDTMRQESAKVTIMNSSSDTYHSATSSHGSSGGFFKHEPITSRMASGVIESHFPAFDLPLTSVGVGGGSPLRSQVLIKSTNERHGLSPRRSTGRQHSASNSPARSPRIPTVVIQYPQKASPTHSFNKSRKIYPATTNTSKSNSFGAEESNV